MAILLIAFVLFAAYKILTRKEMVCRDCGHLAHLGKTAQGSLGIEIVLWCCYLVPGLIYSMWRSSSATYQCPSCNSLNMIPAHSPIGRKLVAATTGIDPVMQLEAQALADARREKNVDMKMSFAAALGVACLVFIFYAVGQSSNASTPSRSVSSEYSPEQCPVVGNTNSRKFHVPGGRHYQQMLVKNKSGDNRRCFADEQEAVNAGFVRSKR